jgi:hypothetical protein
MAAAISACRHDPFKAIVAPRPIGWISGGQCQGRGQSLALQLLQRGLVAAAHRDVLVGERGRTRSPSPRRPASSPARLVTKALDAADEPDLGAAAARGRANTLHAGLEMAPSRLCQAAAGRRPARRRSNASCSRCSSSGRSSTAMHDAALDGAGAGRRGLCHGRGASIRDGRFDTAKPPTRSRAAAMPTMPRSSDLFSIIAPGRAARSGLGPAPGRGAGRATGSTTVNLLAVIIAVLVMIGAGFWLLLRTQHRQEGAGVPGERGAARVPADQMSARQSE